MPDAPALPGDTSGTSDTPLPGDTIGDDFDRTVAAFAMREKSISLLGLEKAAAAKHA